MQSKLTRREFLRRGCLTALGAGLVACGGPQRLAEVTPVETLENAAQIADEEGLQYVYVGNVPGHERNSTFCPHCGAKVIQRKHFSVLSLDVVKGKCVHCDHSIPGVWWNA